MTVDMTDPSNFIFLYRHPAALPEVFFFRLWGKHPDKPEEGIVEFPFSLNRESLEYLKVLVNQNLALPPITPPEGDLPFET